MNAMHGAHHTPELDGIRGIAIALVVIAHTEAPHLIQGGSLGVTMFFVLSGYLITGLLLRERETTGRIRLAGFYHRRARRLLPALATVLVVTVALIPVLGDDWLTPADLPPVLLYYGNWVMAHPGGDLGALGMTWSLAVEEQFYLAWPLVVLAVGSARRMLWFAAGLAAASLLWRAALIGAGEPFQRIYFGSDTVAFAIFVGAALAAARARPARAPKLVAVASLAGIGLLYGLPYGAIHLAGPPLAALISGALLWAGVSGVPWLRGRVLGWLGSRSYGLYLWHLPVLFFMAREVAWPWWVLATVGVPVSLVLAEASYRWVEAPFRARRHRPHPAAAQQVTLQEGLPSRAGAAG